MHCEACGLTRHTIIYGQVIINAKAEASSIDPNMQSSYQVMLAASRYDLASHETAQMRKRARKCLTASRQIWVIYFPICGFMTSTFIEIIRLTKKFLQVARRSQSRRKLSERNQKVGKTGDENRSLSPCTVR